VLLVEYPGSTLIPTRSNAFPCAYAYREAWVRVTACLGLRSGDEPEVIELVDLDDAGQLDKRARGDPSA
jgi:hypothetical protein